MTEAVRSPGAASGERARFDVFLSYNSREKGLVERIARKLRESGVNPWLDDWYLAGGDHWQEKLAEGLARSSACAVFLGPSDLGAWEREELAVAADRVAKERGFRLFLVLLPGVPEGFDVSSLSTFLSTRKWVDLRQGFKDERAFQKLVNAVHGLPMGPDQRVEAAPGECPYRSLEVFDEQHAKFFFGRAADTQRLIEKLKTTNFLAVLGPSGSGKSSLVLAGLVPALRGGSLRGSEAWTISTLKPGEHPLDRLTGRLVKLYPHLVAHRVRDDLATDVRTLRLLISQPPASDPRSERVVWIVDQCEEVFTLCRDDQERRLFLLNLLHASTAGGPGTVILTMRADFYTRCAAYPELTQQLAAHQYLVGPLDADGLNEAIEEPAFLVGLEFEPGLVDIILEEVEHQPGALPLLEHALYELWQRRAGSVLSLRAYRDTGGVAGALAKRADETWAALDERQKAIARRTLLRLTQPGEGTEDTRRRAALSELVTRRADFDAVEAVVQELAKARLVTTSTVEAGSEPWVDVSHEALIRNWRRLRQWLEEDREGLLVHRRLTEAAQEWEALDRDPGALYRGARLVAALEWAAQHETESNPLERAFLEASVAAERSELEAARNRARRFRLLSLALGGFLLAAAAAAGYAIHEKQNADSQRRVADSRGLAGQARASMDRRLDVAALLAVSAWKTSPTIEARDAALTAMQRVDRIEGFLRAPDGIDTGSLSFSPDGRTLAVSGFNRIRLWDVGARRERGAPLTGDGSAGLAYSPRGNVLAAVDGNGRVELLNLRTGKVIRQPDACAATMAFSPDGRRIAFGRYDGGVIVQSVSGGGPTQVLRPTTKACVPRRPSTVQFDRAGRGLIAISDNGRLTEWEIAPRTRTRFEARLPIAPFSVTFAPNGERAAFTTPDGKVGLVGLGGRNVTRYLDVSVGKTADDPLRFSPDGRTLAIITADGTIELRTVSDGRPITRLEGNHDAFAIAFSPDGKLLAASGNEVVTLWRLGPSTLSRRLSAGVLSRGSLTQDQEFQRLAFRPGHETLALADGDGTRLWQLGSHPHVRTFHVAYGSEGDGLAFSSRDLLAVSDFAIHLVDVDHPGPGRSLGSGTAVAFDPLGDRLAVGDYGGKIRIWNVATSPPRPGPSVSRTNGVIWSVAFSPDGRTLAAGGYGQPVTLWDVTGASPKVRHFLSGLISAVLSVAFSPDGKLVVAGSKDRTIGLWDVRSGKPAGEPILADGPVESVAVSPDGSTIAAATSDGNVQLWDERTHRSLGDPLPGYAVAFSSDKKWLATATPGGPTLWPALLWRNETGFQSRLCDVASRNLTRGEWQEFGSSAPWHQICKRWPA
jgi:WD40 repeat protein/energy-coupling factor transporter ATP-binding protein EcfA2